MIKSLLRTLLGIAVSLVAGFACIAAVELFSEKVYPAPPEAKENMELMCAHVAGYPDWILAAVVPLWGLTAFLCTWIARRLGTASSAWIVGLLLVAGLGLNVAMLPYATWFKIVILVAVPAALVAGYRRGTRPISGSSEKSVVPLVSGSG